MEFAGWEFLEFTDRYSQTAEIQNSVTDRNIPVTRIAIQTQKPQKRRACHRRYTGFRWLQMICLDCSMFAGVIETCGRRPCQIVTSCMAVRKRTAPAAAVLDTATIHTLPSEDMISEVMAKLSSHYRTNARDWVSEVYTTNRLEAIRIIGNQHGVPNGGPLGPGVTIFHAFCRLFA